MSTTIRERVQDLFKRPSKCAKSTDIRLASPSDATIIAKLFQRQAKKHNLEYLDLNAVDIATLYLRSADILNIIAIDACNDVIAFSSHNITFSSGDFTIVDQEYITETFEKEVKKYISKFT